MLLSIESLWASLDSCESLAEVDATLRVAAAQGYEPAELRALDAEQKQRLGGIVVQEILAEAGLV